MTAKTQAAFEVIDVQDGCKAVATFPTRRKALNYTNQMEPKPSVFVGGNERATEWRYLIRVR